MKDEAVCAYHVLKQLESHKASNGSEWLPVQTLRQQIRDAGVGPVTFQKVLEALQWCGEVDLDLAELPGSGIVRLVRLTPPVNEKVYEPGLG